MRISIFQSLLFENEAYNIFLAFFYLCSWKFISFSLDLTLSIVGSTFQLSGRHDLIGSSRSVVIFAASQAVRLPAVKLTSFLNFTTRHPTQFMYIGHVCAHHLALLLFLALIALHNTLQVCERLTIYCLFSFLFHWYGQLFQGADTMC